MGVIRGREEEGDWGREIDKDYEHWGFGVEKRSLREGSIERGGEGLAVGGEGEKEKRKRVFLWVRGRRGLMEGVVVGL